MNKPEEINKAKLVIFIKSFTQTQQTVQKKHENRCKWNKYIKQINTQIWYEQMTTINKQTHSCKQFFLYNKKDPLFNLSSYANTHTHTLDDTYKKPPKKMEQKLQKNVK